MLVPSPVDFFSSHSTRALKKSQNYMSQKWMHDNVKATKYERKRQVQDMKISFIPFPCSLNRARLSIFCAPARSKTDRFQVHLRSSRGPSRAQVWNPEWVNGRDERWLATLSLSLSRRGRNDRVRALRAAMYQRDNKLQ